MRRAHTLAVSSLVCLGRRTVTGLIGAAGRQFGDWSADYRLFCREGRFDPEPLFGAVRGELASALEPGAPLVVAMDDSYLPKSGRRMAGVGWARDSHAPPFMTNFVWSQRVLQLSAAAPHGAMPCPARMIPIDFTSAHTPRKPRRGAGDAALAEYERARRAANINRVGAGRLAVLRARMDEEASCMKRGLIVVADGRFTNGTVIRALPENTTLVGRIRKDTALALTPDPSLARGRGRHPAYGPAAPTPEELLRDEGVPFEHILVHAAGRPHHCRVKTLAPVRWRVAGGNRDLRVVVIAPLAYRPRAGARLLYRDPAYLICTDPELSVEQIVQYYVWRWDIEVNFRDEKALLGVGQAQVRTATSVDRVPQLLVASYAMLLLAARRVFGAAGVPDMLPPAKWRSRSAPQRASTQSIIAHLRAELWGSALGPDGFSGFMSGAGMNTKPEKSAPGLASAVLYAAS